MSRENAFDLRGAAVEKVVDGEQRYLDVCRHCLQKDKIVDESIVYTRIS